MDSGLYFLEHLFSYETIGWFELMLENEALCIPSFPKTSQGFLIMQAYNVTNQGVSACSILLSFA